MSSSTETVVYGLIPTDPAYSISNTHGTHYGPIETHGGQEPALEFFAGPIAPQPSGDQFLRLTTFDPSLSRDGFTFKDPRPGIYGWEAEWIEAFRRACVRASKDFSTDDEDMSMSDLDETKLFARLQGKTYSFNGSTVAMHARHDPRDAFLGEDHYMPEPLWSRFMHTIDYSKDLDTDGRNHVTAAIRRAIHRSLEPIATMYFDGCRTGLSVRQKLATALLKIDEELQASAARYTDNARSG